MMYKSFTVSALLALQTFTVKLHQDDSLPAIASMTDAGVDQEPAALEEELTDLVAEAAKEQIELETSDPSNVLEEFDEDVIEEREEEEAEEEEAAAEGSEDCECASSCFNPCCPPECEDENDDLVNIPEEIYVDPRIKEEVNDIVEALDPIIIDLTLADLGLDNIDPESLEADILLPAMQKAYEDLIAENPDLADQLPALPTQLESAVSQVFDIVNQNDTQHEASDMGADSTTNQMQSAGFIENETEYDQALMFQKFTPVVFWFVGNSCAGACDMGSDMYDDWLHLQSTTIGSAFFRINVDNVPEVADKEGVTVAPYFVHYYNDEKLYSGDTSEIGWAEFSARVRNTNKDASADAELAGEDFDGSITRSSESNFDWDATIDASMDNRIDSIEQQLLDALPN